MKQIEALGDQSTAAEEPQAATTGKPEYVADLEAAYGAPSQSGFGSAVFYESLAATDDLAQKALEKYQYFVGDLWERYARTPGWDRGKRSTSGRRVPPPTSSPN